MSPLASRDEILKITRDIEAVINFEVFLQTHDIDHITEPEANQLIELYNRQKSEFDDAER